MKSLIRKKPARPETVESRHETGVCPNCSSYLGSGDLFCPQCGQKRIESEDLSISHIIGESFFDYFHFDSRFFRTIIPLIFQPGLLTIEFMKGKRRSYVEPFKLFLVISVIYFLLLPLSSDKSDENDNAVKVKSTALHLKSTEKSNVNISLNGLLVSTDKSDSMRKEIDTIGIRAYVEKYHSKEPGWIKLFMRKAFKIMVSKGQSFNTVLEHTASKLIFLLIPLFAILLKLFYVRCKRQYFEHLIFSLHIHAFFFLFLILCMIAGIFIHISFFIILLVFMVYPWIALKRYYRQSGWKTLAKIFLIGFSYLIIGLPVFLVLLILIAALTF